MNIKSNENINKTRGRPKGSSFNILNVYRENDNLKMRCNFQIKVKRKYLKIIKKLRKDRALWKQVIKSHNALTTDYKELLIEYNKLKRGTRKF